MFCQSKTDFVRAILHNIVFLSWICLGLNASTWTRDCQIPQLTSILYNCYKEPK